VYRPLAMGSWCSFHRTNRPASVMPPAKLEPTAIAMYRPPPGFNVPRVVPQQETRPSLRRAQPLALPRATSSNAPVGGGAASASQDPSGAVSLSQDQQLKRPCAPIAQIVPLWAAIRVYGPAGGVTPSTGGRSNRRSVVQQTASPSRSSAQP